MKDEPMDLREPLREIIDALENTDRDLTIEEQAVLRGANESLRVNEREILQAEADGMADIANITLTENGRLRAQLIACAEEEDRADDSLARLYREQLIDAAEQIERHKTRYVATQMRHATVRNTLIAQLIGAAVEAEDLRWVVNRGAGKYQRLADFVGKIAGMQIDANDDDIDDDVLTINRLITEARKLMDGGLGPMATQARKRPSDYARLSPEEQWAIDKSLGILDWSGSDSE